MAKRTTRTAWEPMRVKKKTSIGASSNTRSGNKGGGLNGSTISKNYKKRPAICRSFNVCKISKSIFNLEAE